MCFVSCLFGSMVSKIKTPKYKRRSAGFSLPELLVTIAITMLLTGVILFKYADFNSTVLLNSQAFEIALDVREAQVFGLSVRSESGIDLREEYGLYFSTSQSDRYVFFQDSGNTIPASYGVGEELNTIFLDPRYRIISICDADADCYDNVSVTFKRPNFDANFYVTDHGRINEANISIAPTNDNDSVRTINITGTGQISTN